MPQNDINQLVEKFIDKGELVSARLAAAGVHDSVYGWLNGEADHGSDGEEVAIALLSLVAAASLHIITLTDPRDPDNELGESIDLANSMGDFFRSALIQGVKDEFGDAA